MKTNDNLQILMELLIHMNSLETVKRH